MSDELTRDERRSLAALYGFEAGRADLLAELRATIAAWRDPGDTPYEAGWNRAIDAVLALLDEG